MMTHEWEIVMLKRRVALLETSLRRVLAAFTNWTPDVPEGSQLIPPGLHTLSEQVDISIESLIDEYEN